MEVKTPFKSCKVSRLPKFASQPMNSMVNSQSTHEGRSIRPSILSVTAMKNVMKENGIRGKGEKGTKQKDMDVMPLNQQLHQERGETCTFHPPEPRNKKHSTPQMTSRNSVSLALTGSPKLATKHSMSIPKEPHNIKQTLSHRFPFSNPNQSRTLDSSHCGQGSKECLLPFSSNIKLHSSDRMVRSLSLSNFKHTSPVNSPIPHSFSYNKAVELAKPLPNTQLLPLHTGLKPPQCISSSGQGLGFGRNFTDCSSAEAVLSGCSAPSGSLKKPFPNSALSKPSTFSSRTSVSKEQQCPLVVENSPEESLIKTPHVFQGYKCNVQKNPVASPVSLVPPEGTEEMSLSSSSSDRNDTCEDFDQSQDNLQDNKCLNKPTETLLFNFLHEDWVGLAVSSDGSSLELSPSSSSGGTYMWDEEMSYTHSNNTLSQTNTHSNTLTHSTHSQNYKTDSYQFSDELVPKTTDSLNNLEAFHLKEMDLNLDLPENIIFHNDEFSERRKQHELNGIRDHLNNHKRLLVLQGFEQGLAVQTNDQMVDLEKFNFKEILQDCSTVKSQLLQLKQLLQTEDKEVNQTEVNCASLQELVNEVTTVREELRKKEKVITELRQQQQQQELQQCPPQGLALESHITEVRDKSTQTPQRPTHTMPILQHTLVNSGFTSKFTYHRGPH